MKNLLSVRLAFIFFVVIASFISCGTDLRYNEFRTLSPKGWTASTNCVFEVEMAEKGQSYNVNINVRHAGNYPYQDLCLLVDRISPDNSQVKDTLVYNLADTTGKWIGTGSGSVYLLSIPYQSLEVDMPGTYIYKIRHAMSDEYLKGVYAIGLSIRLQDGKE